MSMNIVELPVHNIGDLARGLRALADGIDAGEYGDAHNVAWVVDCGGGRIEIGMMGQSGSSGADAHFLFALGQRKLEAVAA